MSSLGVALLILVFISIIGVIGYNAWTSRREGRLLRDPLQDSSSLAEANRTEPSLDNVGTLSGDIVAPFQSESDNPVFSEKGERANADLPMLHGIAADLHSNSANNPADDSIGFTDARSDDDAAPEQGVLDTDNHEPPDGQVDETDRAKPPDDHSAVQSILDDPDPIDSEIRPANPVVAINDPIPEPETHSSQGQERAVSGAGSQTPLVSYGELDRFDCVVRLQPLDNAAGSRLIELTQKFSRVGAKPVSITAVPAAEPDQTEVIQSQVRYRALQLDLLLVNRNGPINAMEYSEFVNGVQLIADDLHVLADVPDMSSVLEHSRELDAQVASLDAQLVVNVVTKEVLNPENLQAMAKRVNLTEQGNSRYVRIGQDRQPVFSVSLSDRANALVLVLDVPRVPRDGLPIREMVECAWKCAQSVNGQMVDDAGQPIDNALFERIEQQLDTHYQALQAAGIPAGSSLALRIFN